MPYDMTTARTALRVMLNEPVQGFFLNTDLDAWLTEAVLDLSSKSGCIETLAEFDLVPGAIIYPEPVAADFRLPALQDPAASLLKVYAAFFEGVSLVRAHPRWMGQANADISGNTPLLYAPFGDTVLIYPVGSSATGQVTLLCSVESSDIRDLPYEWQNLVFDFALWRARTKERRYQQAAEHYAAYFNQLTYLANALLDRGVNSRADVMVPDAIATGG